MVNAYHECISLIDKVMAEAESEHARAIQEGAEDARICELESKFRTASLISILVRELGDSKGDMAFISIRGGLYAVPIAVAEEFGRLRRVERACGAAVKAIGQVKDHVSALISAPG